MDSAGILAKISGKLLLTIIWVNVKTFYCVSFQICDRVHNWDRIANCVRSQKSNKIVKLNLINIECIFYFLYSRIVTFDSWLPNSAYSYFDFCLSTNKLKIQKQGPCFWWTPWEFFGQIVQKIEMKRKLLLFWF